MRLFITVYNMKNIFRKEDTYNEEESRAEFNSISEYCYVFYDMLMAVELICKIDIFTKIMKKISKLTFI